MTPQQIIQATADAYSVTPADIISRSRKPRHAKARAVACYLIYTRTHLSTKEVGALINREHATVLHHCRTVDGFFTWPKMYADDIAIIDSLNALITESMRQVSDGSAIADNPSTQN